MFEAYILSICLVVSSSYRYQKVSIWKASSFLLERASSIWWTVHNVCYNSYRSNLVDFRELSATHRLSLLALFEADSLWFPDLAIKLLQVHFLNAGSE